MSLKTAICYFSGAGNSFDITLEFCKYIDVESIFFIPKLDKSKLDGFEEVIIVSPVYQFNIPKTVQDFIRSLDSDIRCHVVLNGAGIIGKAKATVKKLFKQNRLKLAGVYWVQMPSSFTIVIIEPKSIVNSLLKRSKKKIRRIAARINKNESKNLKLKYAGKIKRYVGYSTFSNNLSISDNCTTCQKCIQYCPMGNIRLYQGKIEFGDRCISCMSCYNRCESIMYKGKKGKTYTNPNVDLRLMR